MLQQAYHMFPYETKSFHIFICNRFWTTLVTFFLSRTIKPNAVIYKKNKVITRDSIFEFYSHHTIMAQFSWKCYNDNIQVVIMIYGYWNTLWITKKIIFASHLYFVPCKKLCVIKWLFKEEKQWHMLTSYSNFVARWDFYRDSR